MCLKSAFCLLTRRGAVNGSHGSVTGSNGCDTAFIWGGLLLVDRFSSETEQQPAGNDRKSCSIRFSIVAAFVLQSVTPRSATREQKRRDYV